MPNDETKITYCKLPDDYALSIGRLIRAFAEIEDCALLHLTKLMNAPEDRAFIAFGELSMQKKVELCETLAHKVSAACVTAHKCVFNQEFKDALRMRNIVVHGVFLGMTESGNLAFLSNRRMKIKDEPDATVAPIHHICPKNLDDVAKASEGNIAAIEAALLIQPLRQKRHEAPVFRRSRGSTSRKK